MRLSLALLCLFAVASCGHREPVAPPQVFVPFDQRLSEIAALSNSRQFDKFRTHFTKDATIQTPVSPRPTSVDRFVAAAEAEPFQLAFTKTEVVYSLPGKATTRSEMVASAPAKFNLRERVTVDWRFVEGHWLISRLSIPDWSQLLGTWRRSGLKNEGSIELRLLPGNTYVIYTADDYSVAAFRGRYQLEGNKINLTDTSSGDPRSFDGGEGSYLFVRTATGMNLQKVSEENKWRADRFDGSWTATR